MPNTGGPVLRRLGLEPGVGEEVPALGPESGEPSVEEEEADQKQDKQRRQGRPAAFTPLINPAVDRVRACWTIGRGVWRSPGPFPAPDRMSVMLIPTAVPRL